MKPHIAQTIADLRLEVNRLQGIIDLLTVWGKATSKEPMPGSEIQNSMEAVVKKVEADVTTYRSITPRRRSRQTEIDCPITAAYERAEAVTLAENKPTTLTTEQLDAKIEADFNAPKTFSGACKRVLRQSMTSLGAHQVLKVIQERWPDLAPDKEAGDIEANIRYWVSKGYCEKIGAGPQATFRVIDQEFFKEVG